MKRIREWLLVAVGALLPAACGNESTGPANPGARVASVTVTPASAGVAVSRTVQLTATVRGADSSALAGRVVTWTSNNPAAATVSNTGLVRGIALGAALITAASEGKEGTAAITAVINVEGEWNFTEQLIDQADMITCDDTGSYVFNQNGFDIGGTKTHVGTCLGPGNSFDNTLWPESLANGQLLSATISFDIGPARCRYEGSVTSAPAEKLSGTYSCGPFGGRWEAVRGGTPVASVTVRSNGETVVRGAVQFVAVLRDATGHVVDRAVKWSSDNLSVATVSDTGLVTMVASGSARITATSEGKSGSASVAADVVNFNSVSAGVWHSCGLTPGGAAYCWGWGGDGQLGSGFRRPARAPAGAEQTPVAVGGGHTFATVSAGRHHSCGVTTGGEGYCWGDNYWGELGDGSTTNSLVPVRVVGGHQFASVVVGDHHSCGVTTENAAYCWGENIWGQLGDGSGATSSSPVAVAGGLPFNALSVGRFHTCGVTTTWVAYCWGDNYWGELGDGSTTNQLAPVAVAGGHSFVALGAGLAHTCAVQPDGAAYCWGSNQEGALGDGLTTDSPIPVAVAGELSFAPASGSIAAGTGHSCGLTPTAAYCWGNNYAGQLGDGSTTQHLTPTTVSGGAGLAAISGGAYHTCGVTAGALASCWGLNANGEVGAATTASCPISGTAYPCATTPLRVIGQPGAAAAAVAAVVAHVRAGASVVGSRAPGAQRARPALVGPPVQMEP